MTAMPQPAEAVPGPPGPVEQTAQLVAILALVEEMGGVGQGARPPLDNARALEAALADAPGIARMRFDARIAEAAEVASIGVRILLDRKANPGAPQRLAADLRAMLAEAAALIGL